MLNFFKTKLEKIGIPVFNCKPSRQIILTVLFFAAILVGVIITVVPKLVWPLAPDEINWRLIYNRSIATNFNLENYIYLCSTSTFNAWILTYPTLAAIDLYTRIDSIIGFRVIPLLSTLAPLLLFYDKARCKESLSLILFLFCLLLLPANSFWISNSRPEFLFYPLLCVILIISRPAESQKLRGRLAVIALLYYILIVGAHPKFIYFFPVIGWVFFSNIISLNYRILGLFTLMLCTFGTYRALSALYLDGCQQFPEFFKWYSRMNVSPAEIFGNPAGFLSELTRDVPRVLRGLFERLPNQYFYLPSNDMGSMPQYRPSAFTALANGLLVIVYFFIFALPGFLILRKSRDGLRTALKDSEDRTLFYITISFYLIIFFNRTHNSYDAYFWYAALLFLTAHYYRYRLLSLFQWRYRWFFVGAFLIVLLYPASVSIRTIHQNSNVTFHGPSTPLKYLSSNTRDSIREFAVKSECYKGSQFGMVDDHSYFLRLDPVGHTKLQPITYTFYPFYYRGITDESKAALSMSLPSSGISFLGACEFGGELPAGFRLYAKDSSTGMCCFRRDLSDR